MAVSELASHVFDNLPSLTAPVPTPSEAAAGAQAVNRSFVAALAFLAYDILITLDQEVHLIWPKPWTHIKFLYFFIRYVPMMVQIPLLLVGSELSPQFHFTFHDCFIWQVYQGVASITTIIAVDFVLILRVYALYFDQKAVRVTVAVAFILEIVAMCAGLGIALPGIRYDDICSVTDVPFALIVYGAASVIFQTVLFGFTAYKFIIAIKAGWGNIPIVSLLMRDGTWAFIVLFVIMVSEGSLFALSNHAYAGVLYGWLLSAFSFSGYRILLNISHLSDDPARHATTTGRSSTVFEFTTQITPGTEVLSEPESHEMSPLSSAVGSSSQTRSRYPPATEV